MYSNEKIRICKKNRRQIYYAALCELIFNSIILMYMVILCLLCKSVFIFVSIVYTIMCHGITVSSFIQT